MPDKILVVDEQLFMLRLIQHTLEKAGYELIKARNTEEARAAMEHEKPKLVVGDAKSVEAAVLPVASETEAKSVSIPVIRMTDVPHTFEPNGKKDERDVVLMKPFSPSKLVAEVKRLMPQPSTGGA